MKAYITGTDRGLGLGLTTVFLAGGHTVFAGFYGIDDTGLKALKVRYGEKLHIIPLDISSDSSVMEAARLINEQTDSLDVVINNAAILGEKDATIENDISFDNMLAVYNVNALGPLRVSKSILGLLKKGDGKRIINISSEAGSMTARILRKQNTRYGYCGSKSSLNVQSILLQNHLEDTGIRVFLIEPGWVQTWLSGELFLGATYSPEESAAQLLKFVGSETPPDYMFHDLFHNRRFEW